MARTASAASKKKTSAVSKKATPATATTTRVVTPARRSAFKWDATPGALVAEFLGSMLLVSAIIITSGNQFYIGISLFVLAAVFAGISGVNFNPAVSFGLWAMRKMSAMRMFAYWVAQLLGALAATLALHLFSGEKFGLSLSSFFNFDAQIFSLEAAGMAVFMFGFAAAIARRDVLGRAATMGLALFLGLVVASGYLSEASQGAQAKMAEKVTTESQDAPRVTTASTAVLNPAAALVLTETDPNSAQPMLEGQAASSDKQLPSRFTIETLLGTFLGAAVGANLYLVLSSQRRESEDV